MTVPQQDFGRSILTGGGFGSLDGIDGAGLNNGDTATVTTSAGIKYFYWLNATSGAAESSPDVIAPNTNAGNKRWILSGWWGRVYNGLTLAAQAVGFTIAGGTTSKTLTVEDTSLVNQDLTTDASPTFVTAKLSGLTDGYIPKHTSDAVGLANSPIYTDGTNVGIGTANPLTNLEVVGSLSNNTPSNVLELYRPFNSGTAYGAGASFALSNPSTGSQNTRLDINLRNTNTNVDELPAVNVMTLLSSGNVGIGMSPSVQFELSGAVGQKSSGTTWANPSDARLKNIAGDADLDRCWEIVKNVPLKRYELKSEAFSDKQISDRNKLGWIADDVEVFFPKSTPKNTFKLVPIPDGEEEYEEQDFTIEQIEKEETSIEIIEGKPIQVTKIVTSEVKTMLFDHVPVLDENNQPVMQKVSIESQVTDIDNSTSTRMMDADTNEAPIKIESYEPLTHPVPRMIKKTRPKLKTDVVEDCRSLDADQLFAAMYGALQKSMSIIEDLQARISKLEITKIGKI